MLNNAIHSTPDNEQSNAALFINNKDLATPFIIDNDLALQLQPQANDSANDNHLYGRARVFEQLLPSLYLASHNRGNNSIGNGGNINHQQNTKKQQPLEQVDHYMLEETQELIRRLHLYCQQLDVADDAEFKIATDGKQLHILGDFTGKTALTQRVNSDKWFVGSFNWLQPNYANLAHSFEVLEYSYCYEKSPKLAAQRFAHLIREDKGLSFALKHVAGMAQAQVETPLNLYCVEAD